MKDGSTTTKEMETAEQQLSMGVFMRGNGNTICRMVKECSLGLMIKSIKDNNLMERDTDKASISIQMDAHTKVNGLMANKMVKEQ